ncbi:MAG: uracil-DNA glycosylase [Alphaproteobacteria bacterium]|nr:MAG: uracil-DNA glycosylase [Alphaproteobacteria bacterium]
MTAAPLTPDHADLTLLAWMVEMGADEAIGAEPVNRYAAPKPAPARRRKPAPEAPPDPVASAAGIAAACTSLSELAEALAAFEGCALKKGARTCVFADGNPAARLMVIGEAPGREEDRIGKPFVGRSGQLLDRMLAAIGLRRDDPDPAHAVYITNVLPWRPPENREPSTDEIAMMKAFLIRHIELADPDFLLLMGRSAAATLLGTTIGITRLRGKWGEVLGRPALPTFHPAALLRNPLQKRPVWADLLALQARMEDTAP